MQAGEVPSLRELPAFRTGGSALNLQCARVGFMRRGFLAEGRQEGGCKDPVLYPCVFGGEAQQGGQVKGFWRYWAPSFKEGLRK